MEDRIKTALEKAMEKIQGIEKSVSPEELARDENLPRGQSMAAIFLRDMDFDLKKALNEVDDRIRPFLQEGVEETLLRNISLPLDDTGVETNKRAMAGLVFLKKDRPALSAILGEMEYLFDHYEKNMQSLYERLKESFTLRLKKAQQRVEAQLGMDVNIDVENQPAFVEEWTRVKSQVGLQFEDRLMELKQNIKEID